MTSRTKTTFWKEYPAGAIKHRQEVLDLIIEARKEKKAIRLYAVEQSGHLREMFLTSKSRMVKPKEDGMCTGPRFYMVEHTRTLYNGYNRKEYYESHILMGSYDIGVPNDTEHRLFTNRKLAEQYSETLKNSKEYLQEVKEHHERCNRMFRSIDRMFGYD